VAKHVDPIDAVVVGSINRDYVIESSRRPLPGETVIGARFSVLPGGKGANQAVALALLGMSVHLVARVGDDAAGRDVVESLRRANVEVDDVIVSPSTPTGAAFVTVTPEGENSILVASGANWLLDEHDLRARGALLERARLVLLQLEVPNGAVSAAVGLVGPETLVVLNAAPYRALDPDVLRRVDVLVVNDVEAQQLLGKHTDLEDAAAFVGLGPRATVVTFGPAGVLALVDGHGRFRVPAPQRDVVDTTGAGDAFVGALSAWLAREHVGRRDDLTAPLSRALHAAAVAAAHSVQQFGAQPSYGTSDQLGPPWS
jgi:ribokinase